MLCGDGFRGLPSPFGFLDAQAAEDRVEIDG